MSYKFYIRMDGQVFGPYTLDEYHDLDVPDDTEVMEASVGEWFYVSDFPSYEELKAREEGFRIDGDGVLKRVKEESLGSDNSYYAESTTPTDSIDEPPIPERPYYNNERSSANNNYESIPSSRPNKGWNWGAFMFNWIWAIFNGLYWPLIIIPIAFIPHIGGLASLIFCIALGYKGNQWAWNAKTWDSAEHFNDIQHRWAVAAGVYVLVLIGVLILALIVGFGYLSL